MSLLFLTIVVCSLEVSSQLVQTTFQSTFTDKIVVGIADQVSLEKLAHAYNIETDGSCQENAQITKKCTSVNDDLNFNDESGNSVLTTNYKVRIDSTIAINWNANPGFLIDYTVLDQLIYGVTLGTIKHMIIYYNNAPVAYYDYFNGFNKDFTINDINDNTVLYTASTNYFNGQINPCRKWDTNPNAVFYTIYTQNSTIVPKEIAIVIVVTQAFQELQTDTCSAVVWTIGLIVGLVILGVAILAIVFVYLYCRDTIKKLCCNSTSTGSRSSISDSKIFDTT